MKVKNWFMIVFSIDVTFARATTIKTAVWENMSTDRSLALHLHF